MHESLSIFFQLNWSINFKNLDSSHSLDNGHKKYTDEQTQIKTVSKVDGAKIFLNAEKEIFNFLLKYGFPTTKMENVWLSELSKFSEGHGCLEKVLND